ncbi:NfeD family protein [Aquisalimonas sp.]|uniref:NfeD family protein n=1 Tax=unclassified Aquisalimonas TaxID=2644645 RepID=UPI0025BEBDD4|nr:NfeD family protein [Aquisalimonas sp.]
MIVDPWVIWILVAAALLLVDLLIVGGTDGLRLTFTVMAVAGAVAAWVVPDSVPAQFGVAAVTGVLALPLLLWLFRRSTRGEAGAGHDDPRVQERVLSVEMRDSTAGVVFLGDFFPARRADGGHLHPGDRVRIRRFEGITAVVEPEHPDPQH